MSEESSKKYVVVETTYPTNYGCHRGREMDDFQRMQQTRVECSDEEFDSYSQAVEHAKTVRDDSGWFDDYEGNEQPPWNSADMENYDNDEEILIQVMTVDEYKKQERERHEAFMSVAAAKKFEHVFKAKMRKYQVKSAGRVFYRMPPAGEGDAQYNIPAELEIDDETDIKSLSNDLAQIKSLMYEPKKEVNYQQNVVLYQILNKCAQLQELHLHMKNHGRTRIKQDFINGIATSLTTRSLKVLAIQNCNMSPEAVEALSQSEVFSTLEHLDIMEVFDYELAVENQGFGYGFDSDEEDTKAPYDEALSAIGLKLVDEGNLMRLDLGYGYDESILKDLVGSDCLWATSGDLESKGGKLTTTDCREPADWASPKAEEDAKKVVLEEIAADEDHLIAAIAREKLAEDSK